MSGTAVGGGVLIFLLLPTLAALAATALAIIAGAGVVTAIAAAVNWGMERRSRQRAARAVQEAEANSRFAALDSDIARVANGQQKRFAEEARRALDAIDQAERARVQSMQQFSDDVRAQANDATRAFDTLSRRTGELRQARAQALDVATQTLNAGVQAALSQQEQEMETLLASQRTQVETRLQAIGDRLDARDAAAAEAARKRFQDARDVRRVIEDTTPWRDFARAEADTLDGIETRLRKALDDGLGEAALAEAETYAADVLRWQMKIEQRRLMYETRRERLQTRLEEIEKLAKDAGTLDISQKLCEDYALNPAVDYWLNGAWSKLAKEAETLRARLDAVTPATGDVEIAALERDMEAANNRMLDEHACARAFAASAIARMEMLIHATDDLETQGWTTLGAAAINGDDRQGMEAYLQNAAGSMLLIRVTSDYCPEEGVCKERIEVMREDAGQIDERLREEQLAAVSRSLGLRGESALRCNRATAGQNANVTERAKRSGVT